MQEIEVPVLIVGGGGGGLASSLFLSRQGIRSLVDACLRTADGRYLEVKGPAVEIVSLAGEVRPVADGSLRAALTGVVADTEGQVFGGPFVAGSNPICMTFEVTLEEWLPDSSPTPAAAG